MEKIKVIIFGTGEISQIAHHYLQEDERYEVCGFTMDNEFIEEKKFKNLSIIPFHLIEQKFPADKFKLFIPLGYAQVNKLREKKFIEARNKGYDFISYIHPKANISSNANIGKNCFIFEDNTIQPYVTIEDNCILWSGNHIGHRTVVKNNVFISSHVVLSGYCVVEDNCYFGVNATVHNNINIAKDCIVGAGSMIRKDTMEGLVYVGVPAQAVQGKTSLDVKF